MCKPYACCVHNFDVNNSPPLINCRPKLGPDSKMCMLLWVVGLVGSNNLFDTFVSGSKFITVDL